MRLQYMNMFEYVYLDLYDLYSSIEHVDGDYIAADTAASFGVVPNALQRFQSGHGGTGAGRDR